MPTDNILVLLLHENLKFDENSSFRDGILLLIPVLMMSWFWRTFCANLYVEHGIFVKYFNAVFEV